MTFEIRYAAREDLPQVNELRSQVSRLHAEGRPDIFRPDFCEELRDQAYAQFEGEDSDVIVAVSGGTVCGFLIAQYIRRPESPYCHPREFCHVEEFGVSPAYRRQGIGTAMIAFCAEKAKEKGFPKMELDVWEFNEDARKFYEAVGFRTYRRYMEMDVPQRSGCDTH